MRAKTVSLQLVLRWVFHLMCNHKSSGSTKMSSSSSSGGTIELIRSDGVVKFYAQPIQASELMLEFPKHMVCSSDSFYIGQMIPALSEHDQLQPGRSYFLLPSYLFQSVLSFVTITSFIATSSQSLFLKKALLSCQPFHIQKTPSGYLRVNVSEEFISQLIIEDQERSKQNHHHHHHHHYHHQDRVCTTRQLQKDYAQLVGPPRHWKPKLETIKEIRENRKIRFSLS